MRNELVIGPATWWLHQIGIDNIPDQEEEIITAGGNAIEPHCSFNKDEKTIYNNLIEGKKLSNLKHKSFHLPIFNEEELSEILNKVKKLNKIYNFDYCLVHPDLISNNNNNNNWLKLKNSGLPIVIENMDKRKSSGKDIKELKGIIGNFGFGFVLDIQHAFEQDPTMDYARNLLKKLGNHLRYYHVSGETKDNCHSLLLNSKNKRTLINFLKEAYKRFPKPIILEGEFHSVDELKEEIAFLRNKLL